MARKNFLKPCPLCKSNQVAHERTLNNILLVSCEECYFIYANMEDGDIKAYNSTFDQTAVVAYAEQQSFIHSLWFKTIAKRLTKMAGVGTVLDIGCGNGILLKHFLDYGWSAHGVDFSPWAEQFSQIYGYKLHTSELEKSNLPDNYFDVVTNTSTLEHIPQPYEHVREIIRVLKPHGVAYFAGIPNYGSLSIRLNISSFRHNTPPKHVNYFTYQTIQKLFSQPDLAEKIKKITITSYGIPESHRIYSFVKRLARIAKGSKNKSRKSTPLASGSDQRTNSLLWKGLTPTLVAAHYNLGRPFHLGDKLEVTVIKS